LLNSIAQQPRRFGDRFIGAVLVPVLLFALGLAVTAGFALRGAAQQVDQVSAARQMQEVGLAVGAALDELAQSQGGVAIWNQLADQMANPHPDWKWIDTNVGEWLNFDFGHDADLILDSNDKTVYAMIDGRRVTGHSASALREAAAPLVEAVRGRTDRLPSPHERLPGKPLNPRATVRTAPRAIHATDLTLMGTRPAIISVMRIIAEEGTAPRSSGPEPLLVSVRYLDTGFAHRLDAVQMLAGMHFQRDRHRGSEQQSFPLVSARGQQLGYLVWRPDRPGGRVWTAMAPTAALALTGLMFALVLLLVKVGKLMRRDARSLARLGRAHLELKAKEAQAHHLAFHDPLTGLPNRALFNSIVDQLIAGQTGGKAWAVLLVDLDRFKQVNDTLGHLGGDLLIQQVGIRLQAHTGAGDVVARLGGDEFAILLADRASEGEIGQTADAMVASVREPFEVLGTRIFVGASIGIACVPACKGDRSELMRMADIAMYRVKAEGRDGFRFFSATMDESVRLRHAIEQDLRQAIADKRGLAVYYQPQVDASGERLIGLEALLRWHHEERGLLAPQAFVPIAEETGLIHELGRWVLKEACSVAQAWPQLSIAVNLSPVQLRVRGFANEVEAIVRDAGARPQQIELEVTESILLDNDELVRDALSQLRRAGFRIALDDFGTGYSSLSYLREFEVDKLKIDRSFTSGIGEANDAAAIIEAVVRLGHAMGLSVTAEGVETEQQHAFLRTTGCNEMQGFLFSAAVPEAEIFNLMGSNRQLRAA
jgi:diguanylate cyclase (GGDEF)-like protein